MRNVLFIVNEYYPYGSAITNCIISYIEKLIAENYNVMVLTNNNDKQIESQTIINGVRVYRIYNNYEKINNKINNSNKFMSIIYKLVRKIVWIYRNNHFNLFAKKLYKKNKDTLLISCSYPFTMHIAAYKVAKKYKCRWIALQFDPHTNNLILDNKRYNKNLKEEIKIFSECDKVFLPKENYDENIKTDLVKIKSKYESLEFPLVKPSKEFNHNPFDKKHINFVFTGSFYEKIRKPFDMLDFFIASNVDYCVHIYCVAEQNIINKLNEYKKIMKNRLVLKIKVPKEECDEAIYFADFVINIGNSITNQIPSKVYEMISFGKPIVNFFTIDEDTSKKILKKYPLHLDIKIPSKETTAFEKFCAKNIGNRIDYKDIIALYESAEYLSTKFVKEVGIIYESRKNKK